ncbi:D-beta-D-heptose 1-phosphate adenylyltransferase [Planctomycetes bacterium Poly30]|uniref:D-beta-D-heptose 1-phosphate adenylyltransferase n=1 Tax=Saltatorellus ferox TaxID=2528018 RepID=A0A518ENN1_9BACT|nr:D-beta-D-heptose 1-phosphate adenylyltransferase [Planctomycetes bacterium Poly30]
MSAEIIPSYEELARRLATERQGRVVAMTNGCFDVLHVGHVRLIAEGAALGDLFVVALNDDASVRKNKGEGRPLVPLVERMEVIAALRGVDYVTSFREPTAHALLESLRPDVHVKGTDWTADAVPERAVVEGYGGRIAIAGDPKEHSSTDLIGKMARAEEPANE